MKDLLINLAQRQKIELNQIASKTIVRRTQEKALAGSLKSPLVKIVTGPRRAGKSSLAIQVLKDEKFAYFNFEDELLPAQIDGDDLLAALKAVYGKFDFVFFDEIQNVPRWEVLINRLHRLELNIIVTGSNSKLLSQEFSTSLTGRHILIILLPFSYHEFVSAKSNMISQNDLIMSYLKTGGFPEVVIGKVDGDNYLKSLYESIFIRDIVQRFRIRNIAGIRELLKLYMASVGSRFSGRSLERGLRGELSIATVQKYLKYATEAYLIQDLEAFSPSTRTRLRSDRKAYTTDNGFYRAMHITMADNLGVLLENAVFIELLRRGHLPNDTLFYLNASELYGFEADFFLKEDSQIVQVSAQISSEKTKQREIKGLIKAASAVGAKILRIITLNDRETIKHQGYTIEVLPVGEWF